MNYENYTKPRLSKTESLLFTKKIILKRYVCCLQSIMRHADIKPALDNSFVGQMHFSQIIQLTPVQRQVLIAAKPMLTQNK